MAYSFSANQFDAAFKPKSLRNWELPKWYPSQPRQRKGCSKIIANDRGHLLHRNSIKTEQNYNNCLEKNGDNCLDLSSALKTGNNCSYDNKGNLGIAGKDLSGAGDLNRRNSYDKNDAFDLDYIPGKLTPFKSQHPSRDFLLRDKYKLARNIEPDLLQHRNDLDDVDHECKLKECEPSATKFRPSLGQTTALDTDVSNRYNIDAGEDCLNAKMLGPHSITEKPNECCPSPIAPAYANFELAKRMHSNNLDHQPLPDCVADLAFRKLQITGQHPGLALEIEPIATGVGIKTHNAGPTHCTKMKVYRPRTSGVIPRELNNNFTRSYSATPVDKKMGAMDLAICWDYKPSFEPPRPAHIDGSNESAGPAVFTYVKSPRDDAIANTGKSSGVFANTLEETGFFDKDISRQKADFGGRKNSTNDCFLETACPTFTRGHSVSRENGVRRRLTETCLSEHFKSTPDMLADQDYKTLRRKYLGADWECPEMSTETGCKRAGFVRKARSKLCHKIAPEPNCCASACQPKGLISKTVFRAGMPKTDAAGNYISSDSGCSIGSHHSQRVLVIPRPRIPHRKRSYNIDTLVPPFQSHAGGAGEGGYPEHWRLSSVYQHAFKPLEYRKKPLLQTVYK